MLSSTLSAFRPLVFLAPLALTACVGAPKALQGDFAALTPDAKDLALAVEQRVRWGGNVLAVEQQPGGTCLEVLGRRLDLSARPRDNGGPLGRFLACQDSVLDPSTLRIGQEVTISGRVTGTESRTVGEAEASLARVQVEVLYVWADPAPEIATTMYPSAYVAPGSLPPRMPQ